MQMASGLSWYLKSSPLAPWWLFRVRCRRNLSKQWKWTRRRFCTCCSQIRLGDRVEFWFPFLKNVNRRYHWYSTSCTQGEGQGTMITWLLNQWIQILTSHNCPHLCSGYGILTRMKSARFKTFSKMCLLIRPYFTITHSIWSSAKLAKHPFSMRLSFAFTSMIFDQWGNSTSQEFVGSKFVFNNMYWAHWGYLSFAVGSLFVADHKSCQLAKPHPRNRPCKFGWRKSIRRFFSLGLFKRLWTVSRF